MSDPAARTDDQFHIFECTSRTCRFRFPLHQLSEHESVSATMPCPLCKDTARNVLTFGPAAARQNADPPVVRDAKNSDAENDYPVEILLDNVRSIFNVGSIFRTADGAGIQHLHLCGITPTPDHPKLAKTALGAEQSVAWTYHKNGLDAVTQLKNDGRRIWGLEEYPASQPLYQHQPNLVTPLPPLLLIVGNELSGIDPEILQRCDKVYHLPMYGTKRSLNVAVAVGIAIYHIQSGFGHRLSHL